MSYQITQAKAALTRAKTAHQKARARYDAAKAAGNSARSLAGLWRTVEQKALLIDRRMCELYRLQWADERLR